MMNVGKEWQVEAGSKRREKVVPSGGHNRDKGMKTGIVA